MHHVRRVRYSKPYGSWLQGTGREGVLRWAGPFTVPARSITAAGAYSTGPSANVHSSNASSMRRDAEH